MKNKTILVVCALGYATSTMVKKVINDYLTEKGIDDWTVDTIGIGMADAPASKASIIVATLDLSSKHYDAPIVDGVPLISGINQDETLQKIYDLIINAQ